MYYHCCVSTAVWIANKTYKEKIRWLLHKNATSYLEKILKAKPNEISAALPLTSHHKNNPSETTQTYETLSVLLLPTSHGRVRRLCWCNGWQARLANLHEWVRVSLGAPSTWPCATSKQKSLVNFHFTWSCQFWLTSKNYYSSDLCGHRM